MDPRIGIYCPITTEPQKCGDRHFFTSTHRFVKRPLGFLSAIQPVPVTLASIVGQRMNRTAGSIPFRGLNAAVLESGLTNRLA